jgi:hypothetical protein
VQKAHANREGLTRLQAEVLAANLPILWGCIRIEQDPFPRESVGAGEGADQTDEGNDRFHALFYRVMQGRTPKKSHRSNRPEEIRKLSLRKEAVFISDLKLGRQIRNELSPTDPVVGLMNLLSINPLLTAAVTSAQKRPAKTIRTKSSR